MRLGKGQRRPKTWPWSAKFKGQIKPKICPCTNTPRWSKVTRSLLRIFSEKLSQQELHVQGHWAKVKLGKTYNHAQIIFLYWNISWEKTYFSWWVKSGLVNYEPIQNQRQILQYLVKLVVSNGLYGVKCRDILNLLKSIKNV